MTAVDRSAWALGETASTYRHFGLTARTERADAARFRLPNDPAAVLAAFTLNEMPDADRDALLARLLERAASGGHTMLVVEPVAGFVARWWNRWRDRVEAAGGRADEWRVKTELPSIVAKLDRASGLDHRTMTGRSLYVSSTSQ